MKKVNSVIPAVLGFVSFFIGLTSNHAFSFVMSESEADHEIELIRVQYDENVELHKLLINLRQQSCKWFTFNFVCARLRMNEKLVLAIEKQIETEIRRKHPSYIKDVESDGYKYRYVVNFSALFFSKTQPGYVSSLAYESEGNKLWDTFKPSEPLVPRSSNAKGRQLKIIVPMNFESHTKWDEYGHAQWFSTFAEKSFVEDGDGVEAFWRNYTLFSKTHTFASCGAECSGAFEFFHPSNNTRLIRRCELAVVAGIIGAPENCITMILYDQGKVYIRSAQTFAGPTLGADGGTDDIVCSPPRGLSEEDVLTEFKKALQGLSSGDTHYQVVERPKGTLIAVNRYTKSAFFDGYENSTIRVSPGVGGNKPGATDLGFSVATSFYVSRTEATSPERYYGATAAQTKHAIQKLNGLMPARLNCEPVNP